MHLNLSFLAMYSFFVTGAPRRGIIIATSATQFLPNHTNILPLMLNQQFCFELKKGISSIWQRKLRLFHIRGKKSIVSTIIFVRSPSPEDDSDEPRNLKSIVSTIMFVRSPSPEDDSDEPRILKPGNSPRYETKATNLNSTHFNITFYKKNWPLLVSG